MTRTCPDPIDRPNRRSALWGLLAAALAAVLVLVPGTPALAGSPSTMSYQGVLTDNSGNMVADGPYSLTFRLYDVPTGGTAQWVETQTGVSVSKGGFSLILGSVTPLGLSFDQQLYLGISVNGGAELVPRVPLTAAPHALSLRLPFVGEQTSPTGPSLHLRGGWGMFLDPALYVGLGEDGGIGVGGPTRPYAMASLQSFTGGGGSLGLWSEVTGKLVGAFYNHGFTHTGALTLRGENEVTTVDLLGHTGGAGTRNPFLGLYGSSRSISLNTGSAGDLSVTLPADAINAPEIGDEPGLAQAHNSGRTDIFATGPVMDILSVTITTPAAGYIVVDAGAMHGIAGNGTQMNEASFTIKDTPGGGLDFSNYQVSGFFTAAPSGLFRVPISMKRTYFRAAGTHTFYFQSFATNPGLLQNYVWNSTLTATYFPTSYGTVSTVVSAGDAAREGLPGRAVAASSAPGGEHTAPDAVEVDLRALELRAAKLREAAAQAELDAIRARTATPVPPKKMMGASESPR